MKIGNREFDTANHTYIMGILNLTPDSFSDGGSYQDNRQALSRALQMKEEGADIIDVGGESTRPGYLAVSVEEEIARVVPVIRMIKEACDIPVSIDTYKSEVAKAAIAAGADMVNDIWGLKKDRNMAALIAHTDVACCLMHNRTEPKYKHLMEEISEDLAQSVKLALDAGIDRDKIILDPGIGFAKDTKENLLVLSNLEKLQELKLPLLLAASRKSVIGNTRNLPVEERLEGTIVTTVFAVMKHYSFVRVHDVEANKRAVAMAEEILKA